MQITFLIGNGFDLNIGLKTKYSDFLEYYLNQESESEIIKKFKNSILSNKENWSDAELMFGEYANLVTEVSEYKYILKDFKLNLSMYLTSIQNDFSSDLLNDLTCKQFEVSIQNYYKNFKKTNSKRIQSLLNKYNNMVWNYNFVTFNYTNVFSKFLDKTKSTNDSFPKHLNFNDTLSQVVHIHGMTDNHMIFGLDNELQIKNKDFQNDLRLREILLKPEINTKIKMEIHTEVINIVYTSKLIYIFGMSLGETDLFWWKVLVDWLQRDNSNILVIVNYKKEINSIIPDFEIELENEVLDRFFKLVNITDKVSSLLRNQIIVEYNTSMFKIIP